MQVLSQSGAEGASPSSSGLEKCLKGGQVHVEMTAPLCYRAPKYLESSVLYSTERAKQWSVER